MKEQPQDYTHMQATGAAITMLDELEKISQIPSSFNVMFGGEVITIIVQREVASTKDDQAQGYMLPPPGQKSPTCNECGDTNLHFINEGPDAGWWECAGHCALHRPSTKDWLPPVTGPIDDPCTHFGNPQPSEASLKARRARLLERIEEAKELSYENPNDGNALNDLQDELEVVESALGYPESKEPTEAE